MPSIRIPKAWQIPERDLTPEHVFLNRRELLRRMGFAGLGAAAYPLEAGLVRQDQKIVYPVRDGIPVLLIDEGIEL